MTQLKLYDVRGTFADGDTLDQLIWAYDVPQAAQLYVDYSDGDLDLNPVLLITEIQLQPLPEPGVDERYVPVRYELPED